MKKDIKDIKVQIKDYEEICPSCKGRGIFLSRILHGTCVCKFCDGKWVIDWIDKIKNGIENEW